MINKWRRFVGGDCYRTISKPIFEIKIWFFLLPYIGAMAIAYGKHLYFLPILFNRALKTAPY
jgi:hypothetical protein